MPNVTKYKEEYCEQLIKHMSMGYSFDSFGSDIKVGRQTLYDWVKRHKEFAEAKKIAHAEALKFFETRLMAKIYGGDLKGKIDTTKIDTTCLIFALKTRFHKQYGERQKVNQEHSGELTTKVFEVVPYESKD